VTDEVNEQVETFEREELVRALQARERFLTGVIGSLESFITFDVDWRLTFANAAAERQSGLDGDLIGKDVRALAPPSALVRALPLLEKAMREQTVVEFDATDEESGTTFHVRACPLADGGLALYASDVTERMRTEQARRESEEARAAGEERYRQLFQAESDALLLIDQTSRRVLEANAAAEAMYGYSAEEFRQVTDLELSAEPELTRAASGGTGPGETSTVPLRRHRRKDGSVFPVEITGRIFDLQGRQVRIAAVRDVSERMEREEALRHSEEQYRSIVETAAEGILLGDPEGRFTFVNQRMADMLGYPVEELVGKSGMDFTYEGSEPAVFEARAELRAGDVVSGEWKARRRDGSLLWTRYNASPIRDEQGRHIANLAMHTDVTERKRDEAALRESEERLNLALAVGGIATWDFRLDTGVVVWNREHFLMLGYEPGEVEPGYETFLARVHPDDADSVDQAFRHALDAATDYQADFRVVWPEGEVRAITAVGHLEVDASGRPLRQYGVMFDVTERLQAEKAVRRAEAEKAAQVERSRLARDLHDSVTQALFAASLKAEAIAESGVLTSTAALGAAEDVRRLNRGALAQMRTMLLELRGDPIAEVPLQQLLRNLVEAAESRASTKVSLTINGGPAVPPQVHEVLYRIAQEALNNITRHAHAAAAWVELTLRPESARLVVGDDGVGCDASALDPSHIGLASMRERAAEIGARLTVSMERDRGTIVELEWPGPQSG
jgi:PAS domain S-box-containing protein